MPNTQITSVSVENLPFAGGTLEVTLFDKRVDKLLAQVPETLCVEVREALEKKLGTATTHTAHGMQNGFAATWTADMWMWQVVDGTTVAYGSRVSAPEGCFMLATTAAYREREEKPAQVVQP